MFIDYWHQSFEALVTLPKKCICAFYDMVDCSMLKEKISVHCHVCDQSCWDGFLNIPRITILFIVCALCLPSYLRNCTVWPFVWIIGRNQTKYSPFFNSATINNVDMCWLSDSWNWNHLKHNFFPLLSP